MSSFQSNERTLLAQVTFTYLVLRPESANLLDLEIGFDQRVISLLTGDRKDYISDGYLTRDPSKLKFNYYEQVMD